MILETINETIDFRELGYVLRTTSYDQLPKKQNQKEAVIGKDGEYVFENGLMNRSMRVILSAIDDGKLWTRRVNMRAITKALLDGGKLILDYEPDIYWNARVLTNAGIKFNAGYDELTITFDVDPVAFNRFTEDSLTWEDADLFWSAADIEWGGSEDTFTIDGSDITVSNEGNYPALPIIKLDGTGNVTMTHSDGKSFTITGLNGILYIDGENLIVYDDSNVNQISLFSGDFLELQPGDNVISTSGSASAQFIDKDRVV